MYPAVQEGFPNTEPALYALRRSDQSEILGQFNPEQQREILQKQRILTSLGLFIGKDFSMPVKLNAPGAGWNWNFADNETFIDPKDLLEKPMDYLRFVICHEGGHRRISRPQNIPLEIWRQPGFSFMMNAIEDPRDNSFVAEAYPRFKNWMKVAYEDDFDFESDVKKQAKAKLGHQPRFMQAGFQYIRQWFDESQGRERQIDETLPAEVQEVVRATMESARDSWLRYPSRDEANNEALVQQYSDLSYQINLEEVWPEFKKLVEMDKEDQELQEMMQDMINDANKDSASSEEGESDSSESTGAKGQGLPKDLKDKLTEQEQKDLEEAIEKALADSQNQESQEGDQGDSSQRGTPIDVDSLSPELRQKLQEYFDSLPEDKRKELEEKAEQALADFEKEVNKEMEGKFTDTPEKKAEREGRTEPKEAKSKEPTETTDDKVRKHSEEDAEGMKKLQDMIQEALKRDDNEYEKTRREVLPIIDALEQDLREVFVERRANRWLSGFKSGKRIDMKKRIQEKVKGVSAMESQAWQKRELPQEKDYAITLLNDLSGSMQGAKIQGDFKGKVSICEALNRLSINMEILGFNNKIHEYQRFGQPLDKEVRSKMGGMLQEVSTSSAAWNDDGWALEQASERLGKQRAKQKFLIVLSDGLPEESHLHKGPQYELGSVIKRIMETTDQKLIGLGIGPGTQHVERFYPNSLANVSVKEMADQLADLIREAVVNYDTF